MSPLVLIGLPRSVIWVMVVSPWVKRLRSDLHGARRVESAPGNDAFEMEGILRDVLRRACFGGAHAQRLAELRIVFAQIIAADDALGLKRAQRVAYRHVKFQHHLMEYRTIEDARDTLDGSEFLIVRYS